MKSAGALLDDASSSVWSTDTIGTGRAQCYVNRCTVIESVLEGAIRRQIARRAKQYEVHIDGNWQCVKAAVRMPNAWLACKLMDDSAVKVPPNKWRYKSE